MIAVDHQRRSWKESAHELLLEATFCFILDKKIQASAKICPVTTTYSYISPEATIIIISITRHFGALRILFSLRNIFTPKLKFLSSAILNAVTKSHTFFSATYSENLVRTTDSHPSVFWNCRAWRQRHPHCPRCHRCCRRRCCCCFCHSRIHQWTCCCPGRPKSSFIPAAPTYARTHVRLSVCLSVRLVKKNPFKSDQAASACASWEAEEDSMVSSGLRRSA